MGLQKRIIIAIAALLILLAFPGVLSIYFGYQINQVEQARKNQHIGYMQVSLPINQTTNVKIGTNWYSCQYVGEYKGEPTFVINYETGFVGQIFKAIKDSTYNAMNLEIIVGDVSNNSLVLWLKSTS